MWNDTDIALAYLITFRSYGTWLHGDDRGSIDRFHNRYKSPYIPPNIKWKVGMTRSLPLPVLTWRNLGRLPLPIPTWPLTKVLFPTPTRKIIRKYDDKLVLENYFLEPKFKSLY